VSRALNNAKNYVNERKDDKLQSFPFQNPPLPETLKEAIDIINAELEVLGYHGSMEGMYDEGAMYSGDFTYKVNPNDATDFNPT
jgi:hypothetical protein